MGNKQKTTAEATALCRNFVEKAAAEWAAICRADGVRPLNLFLCSTFENVPEKEELQAKGLCVGVTDSKGRSSLLPLLVAAMEQNDIFRRLLEDAVVQVNS